VTGMSRIKEFNLPDLGEGLTEGEILTWLVKVGDTIELKRGKHLTVVRVAVLPPSKQVRRDQAANLFEIVEDTRLADDIFS
jgi:2-oxoisovalerate dehydrogenase E2 component (dihydrolipoyl transacylase)